MFDQQVPLALTAPIAGELSAATWFCDAFCSPCERCQSFVQVTSCFKLPMNAYHPVTVRPYSAVIFRSSGVTRPHTAVIITPVKS